jgi:NADH-quinone oxidoreductase subunit K
VSVSAVAFGLFAVGLYGVLTRRDLVGVLASIEVLIGGPLLLLVGLAGPFGGGPDIEGIGLLVIVVAAAEAAVGLALVVAVARSTGLTGLDELREVRG